MFGGIGSNGELYPFTWNEHIITTTNVPFFRNGKYEFIDPAFRFNVITAAAPNLKSMTTLPENYEEDMKKLFFNIINLGIEMNSQVSNQKGPGVIVLGAIGCGAFYNNPETVSKIAKEVIDHMDIQNNEIVFAIFDDTNSKGKGNVQTFQETFPSQH